MFNSHWESVYLYCISAIRINKKINIKESRDVNGYGFMGFKPRIDLFGAVLGSHIWFWGA